MTTLQQYRKRAADRQKRWRASQKDKGLKRVYIWLDYEAERILHNATLGGGEAKQAAMTALVTRLLQESVTGNDTRLQAIEAELSRQRERARMAEERMIKAVAEAESQRTEALRLAEANGYLVGELDAAQTRIWELEQATLPATHGTQRESKQGTVAADVLTLAKRLKSEGMSYAEIAGELNKQGIPTPSRKGRWTGESVRKYLRRHA